MQRLYDEDEEQRQFIDEQPTHPSRPTAQPEASTEQWLSQGLSQSVHREGYLLDVQEQLRNTSDQRKQEQLLQAIQTPPL